MSDFTLPETRKTTPGVFLLKRWLTMLLRQQENYTQYTQLIAQEQAALAAGDLSRMEKYIRQETCLIQAIEAVKKVIGPLARQFEEQFPTAGQFLHTFGIIKLQQELERMRRKIKEGIEENRRNLELCSSRTANELKQVRKNRSAHFLFNRPATPTFVDIAG